MDRRPFGFKTSRFQCLTGSSFFIHIPALFYEYLIPNPDSLKFSFLLGTCRGVQFLTEEKLCCNAKVTEEGAKEGIDNPCPRSYPTSVLPRLTERVNFEVSQSWWCPREIVHVLVCKILLLRGDIFHTEDVNTAHNS